LKAVYHVVVSSAKKQALSRCVSSGQPAPPYLAQLLRQQLALVQGQRRGGGVRQPGPYPPTDKWSDAIGRSTLTSQYHSAEMKRSPSLGSKSPDIPPVLVRWFRVFHVVRPCHERAVDAVVDGVAAGEERGARGGADGLHVVLVELHARGRQRVQSGGLHGVPVVRAPPVVPRVRAWQIVLATS